MLRASSEETQGIQVEENLWGCALQVERKKTLFSSSSLSQTVGRSEGNHSRKLGVVGRREEGPRGEDMNEPIRMASQQMLAPFATLLGSRSSPTKCGDSRPSPSIIPVERTLSEKSLGSEKEGVAKQWRQRKGGGDVKEEPASLLQIAVT